MFPLSYNTNGLRNLPLLRAVQEVAQAGYEGIELSFHATHFHPFLLSGQKLEEIKKSLEKISVNPICMAVGAADLLSSEPFEPSLISPDPKGRQERIRLISRALEIAKFLEVPVVNFASGVLKKEVNSEEARKNLVQGIKRCLDNAREIILAIEPEPNMFIETTSQAIALMQEIASPNLKLNLDIGHVQCCEDDLLDSIAKAIPYTRHAHIEDIKGKVHHHEIPGEGDIDFHSVFQTLKKSNYQHYLSVELYHHADIWEQALSQSRKNLLKEMQGI
jgi:hydroxypyruvate isomerase